MTMTLDQIVDWIVDHIVRFVFYVADGFPAVDALSGGALSSSDENDDEDEDHSNGDDSDTSTSEAENYCVVDGAEDTKSTEIPIENKDESAL